MHGSGGGAAISHWGPWRARVICTGMVGWLGGVDFMLLNVGDEASFLGGWLVSVFSLIAAGGTLLSAVVRRIPTRWTFSGTVAAVPRAAGLPPGLFFGLLAVLATGVPVLMAVFLAQLFSQAP